MKVQEQEYLQASWTPEKTLVHLIFRRLNLFISFEPEVCVCVKVSRI